MSNSEYLQQKEQRNAPISKKEPKHRLGYAILLKEWLDKIQEIWAEIKEKTNVVLEYGDQLEETSYYKKTRYAKAKLEYNDMPWQQILVHSA